MDNKSEKEEHLQKLLKKEATLKYQLYQVRCMQIKIQNQTERLLRMRATTEKIINELKTSE